MERGPGPSNDVQATRNGYGGLWAVFGHGGLCDNFNRLTNTAVSWVGVGADLGLDEGLKLCAPVGVLVSELFGGVGDAKFVGEFFDCVAQFAFGFVESGVWSGSASINPPLTFDFFV